VDASLRSLFVCSGGCSYQQAWAGRRIFFGEDWKVRALGFSSGAQFWRFFILGESEERRVCGYFSRVVAILMQSGAFFGSSVLRPNSNFIGEF